MLRLIPGGSDQQPTETELVRAFSAGDSAAFGVLVKRHQELVYRVVRRYARTLEDGRDLTQRAFLQAFEAAGRALPRLLADGQEVPFRAWLLRIAVNLAKNHARDAGRWHLAPVEALASTPGTAAADEALERAQQKALTRRAVLALPRRQREVFTLRIDAGLPFAEVAQALGITEGNAKSHFHHAVNRLKEEVAKLSSPGGAR
jgi:RNA polymerase sigma-70 factor (ECF subfamily)